MPELPQALEYLWWTYGRLRRRKGASDMGSPKPVEWPDIQAFIHLTGMAVAVALGLMGQDDADKAVEMVRQIGEGVAVVVGALGVLLPIISALFAGKSASTTAQIRKVESIPDVTVVPITPKGDELVEKAKK